MAAPTSSPDPTRSSATRADPTLSRAFARKIRLSKLALVFERLWPRLWVFLSLAAIFAVLSLTGIWSLLPALLHKAVIAIFGLASAAALVFAVRVPWPTRDEAVRRIERRSGVPHRPASSYEDTLSASTGGAETSVLWQAHRERLARAIDRLKVGNPSPRADRFDPFAVRALAVLLLVPAALLVNGSVRERLASAFNFGADAAIANARLDAWVTPPPYTAIAPILLADGGATATADPPAPPATLIEVPERSLLTLRGIGFSDAGVTLEVLSEGATEPERVTPESAKVSASESTSTKSGQADPAKSATLATKAAVPSPGVSEIRYEIKKSAVVRALNGSRELGQWTFGVIPDQLPTIALSKELDRTPRGSLKLSYIGQDDYGIASAVAKLRQAPEAAADPSKAWARAAPLTGPRLPLEKPPVLALKMPKPGDKLLDASTLLDLGSHPWAGQRVELWLEATDVGGQIGRSTPVQIVLPSRRFKKPLARAVIEQRRNLATDSRTRPRVARALDALTLEPEGFIETTGIFLGLRTAYYRLQTDGSREALKETVDQLWELALKIEDGALSDAERALKEAQDKLAEALQKGADDQEIQERLAELKQKLNEYLEEMQKNAAKENGDEQPGDEQQDQSEQLGQKDLDEMMKELEKNAREGSREEAEKMLSEMKELMERLQANNSPEARAEQKKAAEMMKKLDMLGNLAGKQQQLMDETFGEQKKQQSGEEQRGGSQDDPSGQNSPNSQQGQQGQQGKGQQRGQSGQPQQQGGSQQGEGKKGDRGQGIGEKQQGEGDLGKRQAELREELNRLQKELDELGAGDPDKLGKAEESMGEAEDALRQEDFEEAAEKQGEALEQMRQSAQSMAEQMQKNAQQKMGRGGDTPRDPLGRPQRSQGPDLGQSVKVPGAIDAQRAREILDELRKRSGESLRPSMELDYIDRLLRRF